MGVKRFKIRKDGEEMNSTAVLISFREEILPQRVSLGFMAYQVKPYVYPPLRCYNCQRFAHVAAVCRGEKRCGKCGGGHDRLECTSNKIVKKCCSCGGNYVAAYRDCGAHIQAQQVENIKKSENLSYAEAIKKIKGTLGVGQQMAQPQREVSNQTSVGSKAGGDTVWDKGNDCQGCSMILVG